MAKHRRRSRREERAIFARLEKIESRTGKPLSQWTPSANSVSATRRKEAETLRSWISEQKEPEVARVMDFLKSKPKKEKVISIESLYKQDPMAKKVKFLSKEEKKKLPRSGISFNPATPNEPYTVVEHLTKRLKKVKGKEKMVEVPLQVHVKSGAMEPEWANTWTPTTSELYGKRGIMTRARFFEARVGRKQQKEFLRKNLPKYLRQKRKQHARDLAKYFVTHPEIQKVSNDPVVYRAALSQYIDQIGDKKLAYLVTKHAISYNKNLPNKEPLKDMLAIARLRASRFRAAEKEKEALDAKIKWTDPSATRAWQTPVQKMRELGYGVVPPTTKYFQSADKEVARRNIDVESFVYDPKAKDLFLKEMALYEMQRPVGLPYSVSVHRKTPLEQLSPKKEFKPAPDVRELKNVMWPNKPGDTWVNVYGKENPKLVNDPSKLFIPVGKNKVSPPKSVSTGSGGFTGQVEKESSTKRAKIDKMAAEVEKEGILTGNAAIEEAKARVKERELWEKKAPDWGPSEKEDTQKYWGKIARRSAMPDFYKYIGPGADTKVGPTSKDWDEMVRIRREAIEKGLGSIRDRRTGLPNVRENPALTEDIDRFYEKIPDSYKAKIAADFHIHRISAEALEKELRQLGIFKDVSRPFSLKITQGIIDDKIQDLNKRNISSVRKAVVQLDSPLSEYAHLADKMTSTSEKLILSDPEVNKDFKANIWRNWLARQSFDPRAREEAQRKIMVDLEDEDASTRLTKQDAEIIAERLLKNPPPNATPFIQSLRAQYLQGKDLQKTLREARYKNMESIRKLQRRNFKRTAEIESKMPVLKRMSRKLQRGISKIGQSESAKQAEWATR